MARELLQHEFVIAVIRLAHAKYAASATGDSSLAKATAPSLADCFERLMLEHVTPFATFSLKDGLSSLIKSRGVRAALVNHREGLLEAFETYCAVDKTAEGMADGGLKSMNLSELFTMLREAHVIDEACTTREVTMMFVMVNMDDETYIQNATHVGRAAHGSAAAGSPTKRRVARTDTSAELDFDEFLEIMVRICNEKLPKPRDGPFEQSLNRWLGATLVPALLAASKARKLTGGV